MAKAYPENLFVAAGDNVGGSETSTSAPVAKQRQRGILVVDDDATVRTMLDIGLRHHGFAVWLAAGGQEAVEVFRRHGQAIDIVLLDVRMPGLDGPQTLAALQQIDPRVRCCFMSGESGGYNSETLLTLGASHLDRKSVV